MNNYELIKTAVTNVEKVENAIAPGSVVPQEYQPQLQRSAENVESSRMKKRTAAPIGAAIGGAAGSIAGKLLGRSRQAAAAGGAAGAGLGLLIGMGTAIADEAEKIDKEVKGLQRRTDKLRQIAIDAHKGYAQQRMANAQESMAFQGAMR